MKLKSVREDVWHNHIGITERIGIKYPNSSACIRYLCEKSVSYDAASEVADKVDGIRDTITTVILPVIRQSVREEFDIWPTILQV